MRVIAITNQKGGSGKTTTTVNLAAALAEKRRNVLIIDLDAQRHSSLWYGINIEDGGVYSVMVDNKDIVDNVHVSDVESVSILPSSKMMMRIEKALSGEVGAEIILKNKLNKLKSYDYVLIDCPPQLMTTTINALCAAHEIIVPVETHVLALQGLADLIMTFETVKDRINKDIEISGILACRLDKRTRHGREALESMKRRFKKLCFKTVIRENVKLSEAPSFEQPITKYAPSSNGAEDYRALAKEVIKQEGKRG